MKRLLLSLTLFFLITGCGQSGKLYLPQEPNVVNPTDTIDSRQTLQ